MRLFLKNIILFGAIIIGIFATCITAKYTISHSISFKEPENVHMLFIGASHPYRGIDATLMNTATNRSAPSERYMFSYLKLKKIINDNPQIDTIFIECSPTDLFEHADDKYFAENEMSYFIPLYFPYFSSNEWKIYSYKMPDAIKLIIQKSFQPNQLFPDRIMTGLGTQAEKAENLAKMNSSEVIPAMIKGNAGNEINYHYLRKIIDLCNGNGIKLYGIYFPVYHPEYYYDQEYYHKALSEVFPDLDVLDYSGMQLPDSVRYDAHHLNWYGAQIFTTELKNRFKIE